MNTIRELKQQEKYKSMLKRKNKELRELKDRLQQKENIINEFDKWIDEESEKTILSTGHLTCLMMCKSKLQELKGSDKE